MLKIRTTLINIQLSSIFNSADNVGCFKSEKHWLNLKVNLFSLN